ncbi:unnamed protein product [Blepharisma stoltei]|uniref:Transcription initiation factor TFIID subunit 8 n=1 Tax=Blepharisma stoltei TaxID=1481888 RepID=A0AAU9K9X6_9CILI|nr:unnamed protein product [Blepharisma stoltei]
MSEDYKRQIGKLALCQLAQEMGFSSISSQALDTLEEVTELLIEKIGLRAKLIAEHTGRTECNIFDTSRALDVLQTNKEQLQHFLTNQIADIPFCRENIKFPIVPRLSPQEEIDVFYNDENIPNFLPPFPQDHTYLFTPVPVTRNMDPSELRILKNKEKREIEERLAELKAKTSEDKEDKRKDNNSSPFLSLERINATSHFIEDELA